MMFSREAMTASDTEAATPPRMLSTTSRRLRRGVMIHHQPPSPAPVRPVRAPQHSSGARTTDSTQEQHPQTRNTATRSAHTRPWTKKHFPSRFNRLLHTLGLPLSFVHFT